MILCAISEFTECHMCHTCRHAIGHESDSGIWCIRHNYRPNGRRCFAYEREVGADMPEERTIWEGMTFQEMLDNPPKLTRDEKREIQRLRS